MRPPAESALSRVDSRRAALALALGAPPGIVRVAWFDGATGTRLDTPRGVYASPEEFAHELRRFIVTPDPVKQLGVAVLGAELDPEGKTRQRRDLRGVTTLLVDYDQGLVTMGAAAERLRRLGLAAVLHPSPRWPSTSPPHEAKKWHALVFLVEGTDADTFTAHGGVLADVFGTVLGCAIDPSTLRPETLAFVQPVDGPRGPEAVVLVEGRALDIGALGAAADAAGWWDARFATPVRRDSVPAGAELFEILARHGMILRVDPVRGVAIARCPLAHQHGSGVDHEACAVGIADGWLACLSGHSAAPPDERGTKGRTALVRAWRDVNEAVYDELSALLERTWMHDVRAQIAAPPYGEKPRRMVMREGIGADLAEIAARAVGAQGGEPTAILYTPSAGAGKSQSKGSAFAAVASNVRERHTESTNGAPMGVDLNATRADVEAQLQPMRNGLDAAGQEGTGIRVALPVHEVVYADGTHVCLHPKKAERLYKLGLSAQGSLCHDVGGAGGLRRRCERFDACPIRETSYVPYEVVRTEPDPTSPTGVRRILAPAPGSPGTPDWILVGTHAGAGALVDACGAPFLRPGGLADVDEADSAFLPSSERVTAQGIEAAGNLASRLRWVMVQGASGTSEKCPAPSLLAGAIVRAALDVGAGQLHTIPPAGRLDLVADHLLGSATAADLDALASYLGVPSPPTATDPAARTIAAGALRKWTRACGGFSVTNPQSHLRRIAAPTLRALSAWCAGATTAPAYEPVPSEQGPRACVVFWRSPTAQFAAAVVERQRGLVALDASGDVELMREALEGAAVLHEPVIVPDAAHVRRVLAYSRRATRSNLCPGYGVRWDATLDALDALVDVLQRDRHRDKGPGVLFVPRPLAIALEILAEHPEDPEPRVAALQQHPWWAGGDEEHRERLLEALRAAPPGAGEMAVELHTLARGGADSGAPWVSYFGSPFARGSNKLQHVMWLATVCDPRPSSATELARFTRREPRRQADRMAAAELLQVHGRTRTVQRVGARVLQVHVGAVVPLDWHAGPKVEVFSFDELAAPDVRPPALLGGMPTDPPPAPPVEVPGTAPKVLQKLLGDGWTVSKLARLTEASRPTVLRWIRGERPPPPAALDALEGAVRSHSLPREQLRSMLSGRGFAALWAGYRGAPGLRAFLHAEKCHATADAVRAWCDGTVLAHPALAAALERVLPRLLRVYPPLGDNAAQAVAEAFRGAPASNDTAPASASAS